VVLITAPVADALCATKAMQEYKALAGENGIDQWMIPFFGGSSRSSSGIR